MQNYATQAGAEGGANAELVDSQVAFADGRSESCKLSPYQRELKLITIVNKHFCIFLGSQKSATNASWADANSRPTRLSSLSRLSV